VLVPFYYYISVYAYVLSGTLLRHNNQEYRHC